MCLNRQIQAGINTVVRYRRVYLPYTSIARILNRHGVFDRLLLIILLGSLVIPIHFSINALCNIII